MEYTRDEIIDIVEKARLDSDDTYLPIIEKFNKKFIDEFAISLKEDEGFSQNTINNYVDSMDLFLNGFLTHRYVNNVFTGYEDANILLEDFMNYTYMGAKKYEDILRALRKFYVFMFEKGYIDPEEYQLAKLSLE